TRTVLEDRNDRCQLSPRDGLRVLSSRRPEARSVQACAALLGSKPQTCQLEGQYALRDANEARMGPDRQRVWQESVGWAVANVRPRATRPALPVAGRLGLCL